jgi:hypothetical protein
LPISNRQKVGIIHKKIEKRKLETDRNLEEKKNTEKP